MIEKRLIYPLVSAWLAALILATFIISNPLSTPTIPFNQIATATAQTLIDIASVALTLVLCGALGSALLPDLSPLTDEEQVAIAALVGLVIVSVVTLAVGLLGLFPPRWLAWLVAVAALGLLRKFALSWLRGLGAALRKAFSPLESRFIRWIRRAVVLLLIMAALMALAPPTKWDSLMYHLAGGQFYLGQGRIVADASNFRLSLPQLVVMLYTWLMLLARPNAAALLHWSFGLLTLLILLGAARRLASSAAGWLAMGVLLASSSFWQEFSWPYSDFGAMAYATAALAILLAWPAQHEKKNDRFLILAGLMTGSAIGVKYTAYPLTLAIGALGLWLAHHNGLRRQARTLAVLALFTLIGFAPWAAKNVIVDGNPMAPFVFGAPSYDDLDALYGSRHASGLELSQVLILPIQATVFGVEGGSPFQTSSGPLLLGLLPFAYVQWKRRPAAEKQSLTRLSVFALPWILSWLIGSAITRDLILPRLYFPVYPAIALLVGLGLLTVRKVEDGLNIRRMAKTLVSLTVALAVVNSTLIFLQLNPLPVALGLQSEEVYLADNLPGYYPAMQQINALPDGAKVLMLWEPRPFYCHPRCTADDALNTWWRARQRENDPGAIFDGWRREGYTHTLIFEAGARFLAEEATNDLLTPHDLAALDALRGKVLMPVWEMPGLYTLYEITAAPPS